MSVQTANWQTCLEHAALSDVGLRRANNQDAMAIELASSEERWRQRGHLFVVADGMGAHAAGELASKLAADTVSLTYAKLLDLPPAEAIVHATQEANARIHCQGQASDDFRGMGTTCTSLVLLPQGALVAHVGDSRAYRLRGNRLEQLTFDHSLVWEIRAAGRLAEDDVPDYVPKNIITRSLGPNPTAQVDLEGPFPVAVGDTFLVCSDGLSGPIKDRELGMVLSSMPPGEAAEALVNLANMRGGPDNITLIVARVTGPGLAHGGASEPRAVSSGRGGRMVQWLCCVLMVGLAVAAAGGAALGNWPAAAGCLVGAAAAGVAAAVLGRRRKADQKADGPAVLRQGKGPYTSAVCTPDDGFAQELAEIVQQLRDAATQEEWTVDWPRFNALLDRALASRRAANFAQAVREFCQVIGFMLNELKHQGGL